MSSRWKIIAAILGCLLIVAATVAVALFIQHIKHPRVVARAVAPDGTEFCVVQRFTWDGDLFNTACYYRKPGGPWGWFYYDHEDWYWGRGRAEVDTAAKVIHIYRGGSVTATFEWETEKFRLLRPDFPHRELTGAQDWMPAGWEIGGK